MNKTKGQVYHAKKRFHERLGIDFSRTMRTKLTNQIKGGVLELIAKKSHRIRIYLWEYEKATYHLIYDRKRKNIVTVLYS